jgi:hypothetical protein
MLTRVAVCRRHRVFRDRRTVARRAVNDELRRAAVLVLLGDGQLFAARSEKGIHVMTSRPSPGSPGPIASAPDARPAVRPDDFVCLTEHSVTDQMIRAMHDDVRGGPGGEFAPYLVVICSRALRDPATCDTDLEADGTCAARRVCAEEINRRAARWLEHHHPGDRLYAQLVGLVAAASARPQPAAAPAIPLPRHPLCWECNDPIKPDDEFCEVPVRGGWVSVHLGCATEIDEDAREDDTGVYARLELLTEDEDYDEYGRRIEPSEDDDDEVGDDEDDDDEDDDDEDDDDEDDDDEDHNGASDEDRDGDDHDSRA